MTRSFNLDSCLLAIAGVFPLASRAPSPPACSSSPNRRRRRRRRRRRCRGEADRISLIVLQSDAAHRQSHARAEVLDDGTPLVRRGDPLRRLGAMKCRTRARERLCEGARGLAMRSRNDRCDDERSRAPPATSEAESARDPFDPRVTLGAVRRSTISSTPCKRHVARATLGSL